MTTNSTRNPDVKEVIDNKRKEWGEAAQKNYGLAKERAQKVVDDLSYRGDAAKQRVETQLIDYNTKLDKAADKLPGNIKHTVTRYPWVTFAAILLLGMAVGMLLKPCFKKYQYKYKYYQD